MSASLTSGLTFLLGFGFAFVPSVGPFAAVLLFLAGRWTFRRADLLWGAAAALFAAALYHHQGVSGLAFGFLQVLGPWLVYRAFGRLRKVAPEPLEPQALAVGLLCGLAAVVALGWSQVGQFNPFAYKTLSQAIVWSSPPALYGHTVFVLGAIIAMLAPGTRERFLGLALSALGILVSGSREAAIAWVFVALVLLLRRRPGSRRGWLAETLLLAVMLVVAAGLGQLFGWGRTGFLLDIMPTSGSRNLVQGSEIALGDWWDTSWVEVAPGQVTLEGQTLTSYTVRKRGPESWRRLQQVIPIAAGRVYTLSVWLSSEGGARPGLQGWGQLEDGRTFSLVSSWQGGRWHAAASGPGRVLGKGVAATEGAWTRVYVTFIYEGDTPLYWYVGLAPDQRIGSGEAASFAGFQLEQGARPSAYVPGTATRGLSLGVARLPYWKAALRGVAERPWFGWGEGGFPEYYRAAGPNQVQLQAIPSHAHNLYLHTLFERGAVGFAGLLLLIFILLGSALRARDPALLALLAAVLFINFFDVTLLYGGVLYPLSAVIGWRGARALEPAAAQAESSANLMIVRLVLAASDFLMAYLALCAATWIASWLMPLDSPVWLSPSSSVFYALLLWPIMVWREGLYPGYGLFAPQELRRQMVAATYAGLILAVGTLLFSSELPLPRGVLVLTVLFAYLTLPLGRALGKRLLHRADLWGRPVVILGAGIIGQRVATALLRNPLDGLWPVAFFDDDPAKAGQTLAGLPVRGTLEQAASFAETHDIHHAIVAVTRAPPELLTSVLRTRGQAFRRVQFVPNLSGLPIFGVSVSSLDKLLALEVPNQLASPVNRFVKRALDLAAVSLGGLAISPVLLVLAAAVYLDSPGPVFFGHTRIGKGGRPFKAWKFRTMVPGAEAILESYLAQHPELRAEWAATQKLQNDPRVTRVGAWLRKFSLDELPQLWNVLKGEMSLVGPRPIVTSEIGKYADAFELYKMVRPGLTGYWQVSGRNDTDYAYRVELDSFYVRNWSVWLDIVILIKTPKAVLKGEGAY